MAELPSGTVTFLFTDLEGSTGLWEAHPDAMRAALARHDELVGGAIEARRGYVVKSTGDGFLAAFASAADAVAAPRSTRSSRWPPNRGRRPARCGCAWASTPGRRRSATATTTARPLNRAARLMSVGHGGQILVSLVTSELHPRLRCRPRGSRVAPAARPGRAGARLPGGASRAGVRVRSAAVLGDRAPHPPSNLPAPLDRFVGRVHELREVEDRLGGTASAHVARPRRHRQDPVGGTGGERPPRRLRRPRVLRRPAARVGTSSPCCRSPPARSGCTNRRDRSLLDAIKEQIGSQTMLLVLDNFEQVTAAATVVVELLRDCPELKLLVTSREALNVHGRAGLSPSRRSRCPTLGRSRLSVDELSESEAVQLFVERARAVRRGLPAHGRERAGRGRALRAVGRLAARDRARDRPPRVVLTGSAGRAAREPARPADGRSARRARTPTGAARHDQLELRAAHPPTSSGCSRSSPCSPARPSKRSRTSPGRVQGSDGIDVLDGLELAGAQEPPPSGRRRRCRSAPLDAGDDPRVRGGAARRRSGSPRRRATGARRVLRRLDAAPLREADRRRARRRVGADGRGHREPLAPRGSYWVARA